ncbi:stage III sporulation protein AF [Thermicanus aegyptius]|uniref:stage III sporulation protein AF n=1 Tax=Thermicanus aegyptius TaxID=94009 RepID=UPI0003F62B6D|nr:stage III sporulation protein AF [Thermicanus aegyptius]
MLSSLSDWLKQLISLVLLATIADLLLPNAKIQKYTKVVIGLFILITMLNPLLQVVSIGNLPEKWMAESYLFLKGKDGETNSLDAQQIEKLKAEQEKEMLAYLSRNLAFTIEQELKDQMQVESKVEVNLTFSAEKEPKMEKILVYLLGQVHKKDNKGEGIIGKGNPITPVDPIRINGRGEQSLTVSGEETEESAGIRFFLEKRYGLPSEQIIVVKGQDRPSQ